MPRNLNAWLDICFILFAALILTGILTYYNLFIGLGAGLVWLCLLFFGRERCLCRSEEFEHYCHTVISNVNSAVVQQGAGEAYQHRAYLQYCHGRFLARAGFGASVGPQWQNCFCP